jgi:uncharacterized protein
LASKHGNQDLFERLQPVPQTLFILYVHDQEKSMNFYAGLFDCRPHLHVPGMTEFQLSEECFLGLMSEAGIKKLLPSLSDPAAGQGIPRCELYLKRPDACKLYERALAHGGSELSAPAPRSWGDLVGYCLDPDGHVLAFAEAG